MEKLVKLFEPGKIGKLEIKNRIIAAPLGYGFTFATKPSGFMTDRLLAYNEARAKGGVGLIQLTVGALARPHAPTLIFGPGVLNIRTDDQIPSAQRFTQAIHAHGTKISFCMGHMGAVLARIVQQKLPVDYPELMKVVAPTGTIDKVTGFTTHTLAVDEIEEIVEAFGQGARRGKAGGFDAAMLHVGHGYLAHEFLSPRTNRRKDEYGGSLENRARFVCEMIQRIRKYVGPDFPIILRMNGDDHLHGGITLDEAKVHAQMFVAAGVDVLDISCGPFETHQWQFPNLYMPAGTLVPLAAAIKKVVKVPVIAVGKIDAVTGERILQEGSADFVEMGRALMADPDLPNKAQAGKLDEIRPCIYCGWCQAGRESGVDAPCTVNMGLGRELEYKLEPALRKKKVMVIGGGPAGMEAAATLAERGHEVSLYEKSDSLGGQWKIVAGYLPDEASLIRYLSAKLKMHGVKVFLNQELTVPRVQELNPEAVVVATGSKSATLDVPGMSSNNVVQAVDVLMGKVSVGQEIIVVGDGFAGLDAALYLAEKGKSVSVLGANKIGKGITHNLRQTLIEFLLKNRVRLFSHTIVDSVTAEGVNCWYDCGEGDALDKLFLFLPADTVVLAVGAVSESRLGEEISGFMPEVHLVGDCAGKRSIFSAMRQGSEVGRKI